MVPTILHILIQSHHLVRPDSLELAEFISEIVEVFGFLFRETFFKIEQILRCLTFLRVPGVLFWGGFDFGTSWSRVVVGIALYCFSILRYCT